MQKADERLLDGKDKKEVPCETTVGKITENTYKTPYRRNIEDQLRSDFCRIEEFMDRQVARAASVDSLSNLHIKKDDLSQPLK